MQAGDHSTLDELIEALAEHRMIFLERKSRIAQRTQQMVLVRALLTEDDEKYLEPIPSGPEELEGDDTLGYLLLLVTQRERAHSKPEWGLYRQSKGCAIVAWSARAQSALKSLMEKTKNVPSAIQST